MATWIPHFIGGESFEGRGGRTAPVYNPATGEQTGEVPLASARDTAAFFRLPEMTALLEAPRG